MDLVPPSVRFRESFLRALSEFREEGLSWWLEGDIASAEQNFDVFVTRKIDDAGHTHLWAVTNDEFVGRLTIHHELTEALRISGGHIGYDTVPSFRGRGIGTEMLRLALPIAGELGLTEVLITCDDTNTASIRVIEKNGGTLQHTRIVEPGGPAKRYYRIRVSQSVDGDRGRNAGRSRG